MDTCNPGYSLLVSVDVSVCVWVGRGRQVVFRNVNEKDESVLWKNLIYFFWVPTFFVI